MTWLQGPRRFVAVLGGLAILALSPAAAWAAPSFPALSGRVVDNANLLSPEAEQALTTELAELETKTGHQLVVATIADLQGYEIEDYGYQLLRTWELGDKDRNDGAILIVAPSTRKVRIEVGYGLEPVLTDALSSLIIQQRILPAFKEGKMEQGVVDGAHAIVQQLSLPEDEARAAAAAPAKAESGGGGPPLIFILFILFWVLGGMFGLFGRGRRRSGLWWLLPLILNSSSRGGGSGGGGWGGGSGGGFGGGGFSGGGGSGGGGGASGGW